MVSPCANVRNGSRADRCLRVISRHGPQVQGDDQHPTVEQLSNILPIIANQNATTTNGANGRTRGQRAMSAMGRERTLAEKRETDARISAKRGIARSGP